MAVRCAAVSLINPNGSGRVAPINSVHRGSVIPGDPIRRDDATATDPSSPGGGSGGGGGGGSGMDWAASRTEGGGPGVSGSEAVRDGAGGPVTIASHRVNSEGHCSGQVPISGPWEPRPSTSPTPPPPTSPRHNRHPKAAAAATPTRHCRQPRGPCHRARSHASGRAPPRHFRFPGALWSSPALSRYRATASQLSVDACLPEGATAGHSETTECAAVKETRRHRRRRRRRQRQPRKLSAENGLKRPQTAQSRNAPRLDRSR